MVSESASPQLLAVVAEPCSQNETESNQGIRLIAPMEQGSIAATFNISVHHPDNVVRLEAPDRSLWVAFEDMMASLDDDDPNGELKELNREPEDFLDSAAETLAPFAQAVAVTESPRPASDFEGSQNLRAAWGADGPMLRGELLPCKTSVEVELGTMSTWNEFLVAAGREMQRVRLEQGLSLDQLRFRTQIPVYQLQSLEAGAVEQLPEEIFVRGFLKRIFGQLGEAGQQLLAQMPEPRQERQEILAEWQQARMSYSASQTVQLRSAHLYVGYATLLAGAAGGLAWSFQETAQLEPVDLPKPTAQRDAQAKLNPAQRLTQLTFGSDMAQPEKSAPEINS